MFYLQSQSHTCWLTNEPNLISLKLRAGEWNACEAFRVLWNLQITSPVTFCSLQSLLCCQGWRYGSSAFSIVHKSTAALRTFHLFLQFETSTEFPDVFPKLSLLCRTQSIRQTNIKNTLAHWGYLCKYDEPVTQTHIWVWFVTYINSPAQQFSGAV